MIFVSVCITIFSFYRRAIHVGRESVETSLLNNSFKRCQEAIEDASNFC